MSNLDTMMAHAFGGKQRSKKVQILMRVQSTTADTLRLLAKKHGTTPSGILDKMIEILGEPKSREVRAMLDQ